MPQLLRLREHVHAAQVDGDLVLLDIPADQYLCLIGQGASASGDRTLQLSDPSIASDLVSSGLCEPCSTPPDEQAVRTLSIASPDVSARRLVYPPPTQRDVAEAVIGLLDLAIHYRGRRLPEILKVTRRWEDAMPADARLFDLVDAFHRWIPFAPVSGKCLLRAFMLLRFLRRHGRDASWVFGVATWPFRAHCWLQVGNIVLDDDVERVRAFTPIYVQ